MPLEDLTGDKYITNLNEAWPLGTDYPDAGDNHIRGIKNVLKKQFPNLGSAAVTATAAQLNGGGIPTGARMIFYMSNAPTGWVRVAGIGDTKALRVVDSAAVGGGNGGTDDPVLNNKVITHTHPSTATAGNQSADHTHTGGTIGQAGGHGHNIRGAGSGANQAACWGSNVATAQGFGANDSSGFTYSYHATFPGAGVAAIQAVADHTHTLTGIGNQSANHTHTVTVTTPAPAGASASWAPRYLDVIVCEKS